VLAVIGSTRIASGPSNTRTVSPRAFTRRGFTTKRSSLLRIFMPPRACVLSTKWPPTPITIPAIPPGFPRRSRIMPRQSRTRSTAASISAAIGASHVLKPITPTQPPSVGSRRYVTRATLAGTFPKRISRPGVRRSTSGTRVVSPRPPASTTVTVSPTSPWSRPFAP
jgi:hypothetical protein